MCLRPVQGDPFTIYASRITLSHNALLPSLDLLTTKTLLATASLGSRASARTTPGKKFGFSAMEEATGQEGIFDHEVKSHSK